MMISSFSIGSGDPSSLIVSSSQIYRTSRSLSSRRRRGILICNSTSRNLEDESAARTVRTVIIPYSQLKDRCLDLTSKIEAGFGPDGLGILSISGVPEFPSLRQTLLELAPRLAGLPENAKKELEDPESRFNFGWSHGKEKLDSGKLDMSKGSFYANPILDVPTTDTSLIQRYPAYCRPNIWPNSSLPEFEVAFKALGKVIFNVGMLLAHHCYRHVSKSKDDNLENILQRSRCHKSRLLYYYPRERSELRKEANDNSAWCGWHTDHGSLTGLTCGMFTKNSTKIACPDSAAGLYVKTRDGQFVKVVFGDDEIAYQIGETTEILSGGRLCATPHCVMAPKGENSVGVGRSTFALFLQPDWEEKLNFPENVHLHQELIRSNGSLTFGEYTELLLNKYYHLQPKADGIS